MKTLLNLLPEEKKREVHKGIRSRFILWQLFLIFMLEIFILSILLGVYMVLDMQLRSLQSVAHTSMLPQEKKLNEFEGKFRGVNEAIDVIGKFHMTHLSFTNIFLLLNETLPEGIHLNRLTTKDYTVTLTGIADKREDALALEAELKNNECVSRVNLPLSNLFSQENVDFQMDFDIKPTCLRK